MAGYTIRELVPWWARISAKIVLSRFPVGYSLWRKINLFTHGVMYRSDYALGVFRQHFAKSGLRLGQPFVALELGPGDSVSSAIIAAAHGAVETHLVDAGPFATSELSVYRNMAEHVRSEGLAAPDLSKAANLDDVLRACNSYYGTSGLESLRRISSGSVDFIWSQAVLEHIRRKDFPEVMREMRRSLRSGGVCSHQIDLRDHLGGALNNRRVPSSLWEADWMARSGFYTNRLHKSEMIRAFQAAGFSVEVVAEECWDALPTRRNAMASEFRSIDTAELLTKSFAVILRAA
jgi:SAM-dependent methyltransferase